MFILELLLETSTSYDSDVICWQLSVVICRRHDVGQLSCRC